MNTWLRKLNLTSCKVRTVLRKREIVGWIDLNVCKDVCHLNCCFTCFLFVTYGDSGVTYRLSDALWNNWRTYRTRRFKTAYTKAVGFHCASVYFTPIFTTCRTETNLDVVFSSISRSFKVVLCHACRGHSNHVALPSTASYVLLSYILCIYFSMDL